MRGEAAQENTPGFKGWAEDEMRKDKCPRWSSREVKRKRIGEFKIEKEGNEGQSPASHQGDDVMSAQHLLG